MEKTTIAAKSIGVFNVIENPNKRSGYKMVKVPCTINGKKAEMTIEETYKYKPEDKAAKMTSWKFISGDAVVDATAKVFTDFLTFTEITGMEVDINDILFDAENLFAEMKKKEEEEKKAQAKIARAKAYDENLLLTTIKPALEEKGHKVASTTTKEEFINGRDISLAVNGIITVHYDCCSGYLVAANDSYGDNRVEKKTKSAKTGKILSIIEEAVKSENYRRERIRENKKALAGAKENLESILGIVMVEKKEYHSRPNGPRGRSSGYETSYFVDAEKKDTYLDGLRFVESSRQVSVDGNMVTVKGFSITNLPCITDPVKLKKIYDLLNE